MSVADSLEVRRAGISFLHTLALDGHPGLEAGQERSAARTPEVVAKGDWQCFAVDDRCLASAVADVVA